MMSMRGVVLLLLAASCANPQSQPSRSDITTARRALGAAVESLSEGGLWWWAPNLEAMHGGASPAYGVFARDFLAAAGEDVVPIVKKLLKECDSDSAWFLLASVLGDARRPEALPLLSELLGPHDQELSERLSLREAALHSIGLLRSPEGAAYLLRWFEGALEKETFRGRGYLYDVALQAVGMQGPRAVPYLVAKARKIPTEYPRELERAETLQVIRGADAEMRSLLGDEDPLIRRGAALALSWSDRGDGWAEPGKIEAAGRALLRPRNVPDVWNRTVAARRDMAERFLPEVQDFDDTQYWEADWIFLAALARPEKARPLFERLIRAVPDPATADVKFRVTALTFAFCDQPGLDLARLRAYSALPEEELVHAVLDGLKTAGFPGKEYGESPLIKDLLSLASQSGDPRNLLEAIQNSGIPETILSSALHAAWDRLADAEARSLFMSHLWDVGLVESVPGTMRWVSPASFLLRILKEGTQPDVRLIAALKYLGSGATPDAATVRILHDLATGPWEKPPELLESSGRHEKLVEAYFAKYGTRADLPKIKAPRALDAIRLKN